MITPKKASLLLCTLLISDSVFGRPKKLSPVPTMTIVIYNSSSQYSIYPVLSTGAHSADNWMDAAFNIPQSQVGDHPYPTPDTFRLYFNPTGTGIPPGGSITVTLPLYTQLVPDKQLDPKAPNQYVDWWNGGRISIYESLYATGKPPKALIEDYTARSTQTLVTAVAGATVPVCPECQQPLEIFEDTGGELPSNDPFQLTEYTLGAINLTKDPYQLDVHNVDYDVSYVDNAYLPVAMEPYNNPIVGYVGTVQGIDTFKSALRKFLAAPQFAGWPQFVNNDGTTLLRIPSPVHITLDQTHLTPAPPWAPVTRMTTLWNSCIAGSTAPICPGIQAVEQLLQANYTNYTNNYSTTFKDTCDQSKQPETLDLQSMLAHAYGWSPFNKNCDASTNLLQNTPGYQENNSLLYQQVKADFDGLQYWPTGDFDPYVILIHGADYLNTPNVYAYSVDDAVGNMQTTGDGLILAVGGVTGLPNTNPATPPIHVPFGWAATDKVRFLQYGICTETPNLNVNPDFHSFDLSTNQLADCTLSFVDNQNPPNKYFFKITKQPPFPSRPPDGQPIPDINKTMIDCSQNGPQITDTWCANIFGYSETVVSQRNNQVHYISVPAPAQPPHPHPKHPRPR
jgi:hypothetical protein